MRTLRRRRDQQRPGYLTVVMALASGEPVPGPGDTTAFDDIGAVRILAVRRVDSPEPGLAPGEQVLAFDVLSLETSGGVPDTP